MNDRLGGRPKPRVHPGMNTETKRHLEKAAYRRKLKYRTDPLDEIEGGEDEGLEDEIEAAEDSAAESEAEDEPEEE